MPASETIRYGRKRAVAPCPNPLFLLWLTELRDQAKERGVKTQHVYQKAINSLKKYPLPLQSGKEAKILQNFGDGICKILDHRLQKHYEEHGADAPIHSLPSGVDPPRRHSNIKLATSKPSEISRDVTGSGNAAFPSHHLSQETRLHLIYRRSRDILTKSHMKNLQRDRGKEKGRKKKREYVPQKRTGGYAVLLTLYRHCQIPGSKGFMYKMELQRDAQALCDKSFTAPDLGSKYTAWSSVNTLIHKDLLIKTHSPARYSLTELGMALAEKLESSEKGSDSRQGAGEPLTVDLMEDESEEEKEEDDREDCPAGTSALPEPGFGITGESQPADTQRRPSGEMLLPGSYDIVLCVDFIETTGGCTARKQELVKELQRNGVTFDIRKLNVGDFLWVARERLAPMPGQLRPPAGKELVLDYVIERKRIDDLCGSIIDGRFREQKFRLKRCGLRRPIYLVEECGSTAAHLSLPESTLQQAMVNTQVVDGFFVKRVQDVKESAAYLTVMTRQLQKLYQGRTLFCRSREGEGEGGGEEPRWGRETEGPSCSLLSFSEFNHGAVKNKCQTVREVFARQLMQISGISGDKAAAILDQYSTVSSLLQAYQQCPSEMEREKLLSSIRYGKLKRNVGPALSRTVYQLYCTPGPLS